MYEFIHPQRDINPQLASITATYFQTPHQRPLLPAEMEVLALLDDLCRSHTLILDSGVGTASSTEKLAQEYPTHLVIGVDRSWHRLHKNAIFKKHQIHPRVAHHQNIVLVQLNCFSLWHFAVKHHWRIDKHFIYYPNPYPKASQIKKRYYAHPSLVDLVKLSPALEVRSNWELYLQEFAWVLNLHGFATTITTNQSQDASSRFEAKYIETNTVRYQLLANL